MANKLRRDMIKGAAILAVGFGLGYAKAVHDLAPEDVRELARIGKEFFADATEMIREDLKKPPAVDVDGATQREGETP